MKITIHNGVAKKIIELDKTVVLSEFITTELPDHVTKFLEKNKITKCEFKLEGELELIQPPRVLGALFG